MALTHGISRRRVEEVIDLVGLREVVRKRVGGFSLGMGQRLGVAAALLGDPATLVLDEPVNGLDPEGVRWIRNLLRTQVAQGRTVFLSSHLMSEMALTADHLIVIGKGKLIADTAMAEFTARASQKIVRVRSDSAERLRALVAGPQVSVTAVEPGLLEVHGLTSSEIGHVAWQHSVPLRELTPVQASLEEAFMELTQHSVEYGVSGPVSAERQAS
jgi:ABC-2 type transport system ATP-binding protein